MSRYKRHEQFRRCPDCDSPLDPQERCDCQDHLKEIKVVSHLWNEIEQYYIFVLNNGDKLKVIKDDYEDYRNAHPLLTEVFADKLAQFIIERNRKKCRQKLKVNTISTMLI